ncbi:MAG: ABC transporter ATP-binding protein [Candidatus Riflebacteria bacterium]|nr:ABC transporter ATP-binding protein [Candidatus Riflebacteria bacterium]
MKTESSPEIITGKKLFIEVLLNYKKPLFFGILSLAVTDITDISPPLIIKAVIDGIEKNRDAVLLLKLTVAYLLISLVQGFFRFLWRKFFIGTSHMAAYFLRKKIYEHVQLLPSGFFNRMKTGELMSRLTGDIEEARTMFGLGLLLFMDALFYFLTVPIILFTLSAKLTMYILIPLPFIPFFVVKVGRLVHERSTKVQERLADFSAKVQENISGIRIIKAFAREKSEIFLFSEQAAKYLDASLALAKIDAFFHPSLELAWGFGIFTLLLFGGIEVANGAISIGSFVAFQAYLLKMVWPMTAIGMVINLFQRGLASLDRCSEILNQKPEITDPPKAQEIESGEVNKFDSQTDKTQQVDNSQPEIISTSENKPVSSSQTTQTTQTTSWKIEVRNLSFKYDDANEAALDNISFTISPEKSLGITGPIGSGKSTLIMLLIKFFKAPANSIFFDGIGIENYSLYNLRRMISYVPQETFLFSDSIANNIAFGMDNETDIPKIIESVRIAQIKNEIDALPSGISTMLGERGVNLSGGQKQRLSLARAFAKDSPILLIDDAISAVDAETETKILKNLFEHSLKRTSIIVSHRLAAIQKTDMILYMHSGKIIERGSHEKLIALGGHYARLWEKQLLKHELERDQI